MLKHASEQGTGSYRNGEHRHAIGLARCSLYKGVLDLTPGDGTFAKVAIDRDLIYVGVVMTDTHGEVLKTGIIAHILEQMSVESSPLYDVRYALYKKEMNATPEEPVEPKPKKQKKEEPKKEDPKPKKKKKEEKEEEPKGKKPKKKAKAPTSSGSSPSDSKSGE
jgi:hypothetical protein